jgi:MOSC domain-containing protein YiiM
MRVISLCVGLPREVDWHGRIVLTSIFKTPVKNRLRVTGVNLEGDRQSDLTVHGGVNKAVYAYPSEHYEYWRRQLPDTDLPWGVFGENLTTEGLLETDVRIGDRIRVGSAEFVVTQPRLPCFKLGIRLGRPDILKQFLQSGRSGFYLAVKAEGYVGPGDSIELIAKANEGLSVADVINSYTADEPNQELLRRATVSSILPEFWKDHFRKRLRKPDTNSRD